MSWAWICVVAVALAVLLSLGWVSIWLMLSYVRSIDDVE